MEVRANLERYVLGVKARVAPDRLFGIGLRLSNLAVQELSNPEILDDFARFMEANGLYVFTINGFPYGQFHGTTVKERVYVPDWLDERRLAYTNLLAELLAKLLPSDLKVPNLEGTISTVPGAFRARIVDPADETRITERLLRHAVVLHGIRERYGRVISLALEPEPCCLLETVADTVTFFQRHVFSMPSVAYLAQKTGMRQADSEAFLRHHIGVCVDACHMAVEFEDPQTAIRSFQAAGIRIAKVQISAGLTVLCGEHSGELLASLARFSDGIYLHQVVEQTQGRLIRYRDLPDALRSASRAIGPSEWRIHVHVPLFREQLGAFLSTQPFVRSLMAMLGAASVSQHLEIETYTWSVLPEEYRGDDIVTSVVREMQWVLNQCRSNE